MNEETQIYLDELVKAVKNLEGLVEAVDSPDWWSIAVTFFAAVVAAWITWYLGKRQNKLQEQQLNIQEHQNELQEQQVRLQEQQNQLQKFQTEIMERQLIAQEYDIYKQLYSVIKDVNRLADVLLMHIYEHFSNETLKRINFSILKRLDDDIEKLNERLSNNSLDFELKLNGDLNDLGAYQQLIFQMRLLALQMKEMERKKQIVFKEGADENPILLERRGEKNALINAIVERVADEYKETTKHLIDSYLLVKNQVMDFNTLEKIKDRITPNNKK